MFTRKYGDVFKGDAHWRKIRVQGRADLPVGPQIDLRAESAVFRRHVAPAEAPTDIIDARVLGLFLDSITTDHISPAGSIKADSPAGKYLIDHKVSRSISINTARGAAITR
jgi:aconitate hydratase